MCLLILKTQNTKIYCICGKCLILCPCTDLSVSSFLHISINIFLSVCFLPLLILLYWNIQQVFLKDQVICYWTNDSSTLCTDTANTFTLWVSPYGWGLVEQRGSGSVAVSRSLKMLLGVITSDCNQNSFKWTTEALTEWFHQRKSGQFQDYDL